MPEDATQQLILSVTFIVWREFEHPWIYVVWNNYLFILVYYFGSYDSEDSYCGRLDYDTLVCCMGTNVSEEYSTSMFMVEVTIVSGIISTFLPNVNTFLLEHIMS
jgi:hypothetical protein